MRKLQKPGSKRSILYGILLVITLGGCDQNAAPTPEVWQSIPLNSGASFSAIYFSNAQNGWLAGGSHLSQGGLLGTTADGGLHWSFSSRVGNDKAKHLTAIHFFNGKIGLAGTDNGEIVRTSNGGRSWKSTLKLSDRFGNRVSDFAVISPRVVYAVIGDQVVRSRDRGSVWQCLTAANGACPAAPECPEADLNPELNGSAIAMMSPSGFALISNKTKVATSEDGGCTWRTADSLTGQDLVRLNDLFFVGPDHGWVVGDNGLIAMTSDGGRRWSVQNAAVAAHLTAVHFVDHETGYVVGRRTNGEGSVVLHTANAGESWVLQQNIENDLLADVFVSDSGEAWAIGGVLDVTKGQRVFRKHRTDGVTMQ